MIQYIYIYIYIIILYMPCPAQVFMPQVKGAKKSAVRQYIIYIYI